MALQTVIRVFHSSSKKKVRNQLSDSKFPW
jgi:hypothetical protein